MIKKTENVAETRILPELKSEVKMVEWFDDHFYKVVYLFNGKEQTVYLPSVTTKLGAVAKPFLIRWYGDLGTREAHLRRNEAADRGSRLHLAWQVYTTGGAVIYQPYKRPVYTQQEIIDLEMEYDGNVTIIYNQDEMYDMTKLKRWVEVVQPEFLHSEKIVYDIEEGDAGTTDNIVRIKGGQYLVNGATPLELTEGNYILDLKTGNSIGEAKIQTSRYAKLAVKMGLVESIEGALTLHTDAQTKKGIEGMGTIYVNTEEIEQYNQDYLHIAHIWQREFGDKKPKVFEIPSLITLRGK